jgi:hypothetical protein
MVASLSLLAQISEKLLPQVVVSTQLGFVVVGL